MKRGKLLNAELSGLIAAMGHGDLIVIGDAGLPVPAGVRCIDLAVTRGVPGFFDVLDAVLSEMVVERAAWAAEAAPDLSAALAARALGGTDIISHHDLKAQTTGARAIIRTGEYMPYANVCLWAGVDF